MSFATDHPIVAREHDRLDRSTLAWTLQSMLSADTLTTPITLGIYGGWGTGKTSVMRMVQRDLAERKDAITLWFDAWKYARSDESLWRALLLQITDELGDEEKGLPKHIAARAKDPDEAKTRIANLQDRLESLRISLYRSRSWTESGPLKVNWRETLPFAADLVARAAGISGPFSLGALFRKTDADQARQALKLLEREETRHYQEHVTSLEQFERELTKLIETEIEKAKLRLYVFVDDLDRCMPEEAVSALEAVKLFLHQRGCVFLLGMDRDAVEHGIRRRYPPLGGDVAGQIDPRQYLDKIIQVPFNLPPLSEAQITNFLGQLLNESGIPPQIETARELIYRAAPPNPRTLKRILNVLILQFRLRDEQDVMLIDIMAKLVLMQVLYEPVYDAVAVGPETLSRFETILDTVVQNNWIDLETDPDLIAPAGSAQREEYETWSKLRALGADAPLVDMVRYGASFAHCLPDTLLALISQSQATSSRSFEDRKAQPKMKI